MAMAMPVPMIANVSRLPCISGRSSAAKPFVASYPFKLFGLRFSAIPQPPLASSTSSYFGGSFLSSTIFGSRSLLLRGSNIVKVKAGKASLGCTKRSKSRLTRARTSGFRARIQTPTGRNVLKRRRAKGRKRLVPATNPNSGKFA